MACSNMKCEYDVYSKEDGLALGSYEIDLDDISGYLKEKRVSKDVWVLTESLHSIYEEPQDDKKIEKLIDDIFLHMMDKILNKFYSVKTHKDKGISLSGKNIILDNWLIKENGIDVPNISNLAILHSICRVFCKYKPINNKRPRIFYDSILLLSLINIEQR